MKKDRPATEKKIYNAFLSIFKVKGAQGVGINKAPKNSAKIN